MVITLLEAIGLVFLVMLVFLQNFRATLIPTIAVPVVLLGTFGLLNIFGFSINTLTMLAMVLAVGLLVDDAIVVVENVERVMSEKKLSPIEAARVSMDEISGALVGIVLVLTAVFLPMAAFFRFCRGYLPASSPLPLFRPCGSRCWLPWCCPGSVRHHAQPGTHVKTPGWQAGQPQL